MSRTDIQPETLIRKSSLKPVIFSLLILLSGIIIGAGGTLLLIPEVQSKPNPPGPEYMSKRTVDRIVRELNLSEEQRELLGPIVENHMRAIDEVRNQARPKISELLKQMNEQILGILDADQKIRWEESVRRMQEHFARMRDRDRRGPRDGRRDSDRPRPEPGPGEQPRFRRSPERMPPDQNLPSEPSGPAAG